MRIVQINSSYGSGSTGKICAAISSLLDSRNIENYVFYSGFNKQKIQNGYLVNGKLDIRVHQVLSRLFGDQGWHSSFATRKLVKQLEKIDPDIVHLHNIHGYYLNMDVLFDYLGRAKKPVVWTLHDCWGFTGHCAHFTVAKCARWKEHCTCCPQQKEYPYSLFWDRSSKLFDKKRELYRGVASLTITTVSNWLAKQVKASKLLSNRRIEVISNGINLQVFKPKERLKEINGVSICAKKVLLGVANYWGPRKGLQDFIALNRLLNNEYQIVLVGLNDEQKRNLPKDIIGISRTENVQDLVSLYSSADVFINPSTEETFGLTTVEALACGTPVIVYNSTANPELIRDDIGEVVEPHDIIGLRNSIVKMTKKSKAEYSRACVEYVSTHFDETKGYEKYIDLYMRLAENYV